MLRWSRRTFLGSIMSSLFWYSVIFMKLFIFRLWWWFCSFSPKWILIFPPHVIRVHIPLDVDSLRVGRRKKNPSFLSVRVSFKTEIAFYAFFFCSHFSTCLMTPRSSVTQAIGFLWDFKFLTEFYFRSPHKRKNEKLLENCTRPEESWNARSKLVSNLSIKVI